MKKVISLVLVFTIVVSCFLTTSIVSSASNTVALDYIQNNMQEFAKFIQTFGSYDKSIGQYVYEEDVIQDDNSYIFNTYYYDTKYNTLSGYMYSPEVGGGASLYIDIPLSYNGKATVYYFYKDDSNNYFDAYSVINIPNYRRGNATFYYIEGNMYIDNVTLNQTCNELLFCCLMYLDETLYNNVFSPIAISGFGFCNYCSHEMIRYTTKATLSKNGYSNSQVCRYCGLYKQGTILIPKISSIKLSKTAFYYNGKIQTPRIVIRDSRGNVLKEKTDYTITLSKGRKNIGKYAVVVTFKGNYSGKKVLYYTINPGKTSITKISAEKKEISLQWKKVSGVTGYQIQYATNASFKQAKSINVSGASTVKKTIKSLNSGKTFYVRVRTYKATLFSGKRVYVFSGWSAAKSVKVK